jgi:uncharacterized protein (UPF0261 family)
MRALPSGVPKLMVSTMASGNVSAYVGACDITMAYSVTDMTGLNRISRRVLGNAAHAVAGMMLHSIPEARAERRYQVTMFGVTTACVPEFAACWLTASTASSFTPRHRRQSMEKLLEMAILAAYSTYHYRGVRSLFGGVLACRRPLWCCRSHTTLCWFCGPRRVNRGTRDRARTLSRTEVFPAQPQITVRTTVEEKISAGSVDRRTAQSV